MSSNVQQPTTQQHRITPTSITRPHRLLSPSILRPAPLLLLLASLEGGGMGVSLAVSERRVRGECGSGGCVWCGGVLVLCGVRSEVVVCEVVARCVGAVGP